MPCSRDHDLATWFNDGRLFKRGDSREVVYRHRFSQIVGVDQVFYEPFQCSEIVWIVISVILSRNAKVLLMPSANVRMPNLRRIVLSVTKHGFVC